MPEAGLDHKRTPDSDGEGGNGQEVMGDVMGVVAEEGDAGEDGVAGHGSGEDAAVSQVEKGVKESAGEGQEERRGEGLCGAALGCGG